MIILHDSINKNRKIMWELNMGIEEDIEQWRYAMWKVYF